MAEEPKKNHGKQIGDIVRDSFESGDLSRLANLGPVVESAVKDVVKNIPSVSLDTRQSQPPAVRPQQHPQPQYRPAPPQPYQPWRGSGQRQISDMAPKGAARIVLGVMGLVAFGIGTLIAAAFSGPLAIAFGSAMPLQAGFGVMTLLSGALLASGMGKNKLGKMARQIYALFARKPVYTFPELAAATGMEPRQIRKTVAKAQKEGMLKDLRFDDQMTCLMRGEEAWQQYLESQKSMAERAAEEAERQRRLADPATADLETFRSEGIETIRKIQSANDAIPGEEISEKLSKLEGTCARIFTYVEKYPEKLPETRKFMSYYLPTTLKLVEKYREFEEMEYQPANVVQTKAEIERSLDTIDLAFNNLLESLFQHETLDVSTDIEVLEKMLEQEGLTGRKFEVGGDETPGLKL